jgi:hypothetical protein
MVGEKVEWIGAGEGRTPDRSPVSVESLAEKGTRIRASRVSLLEENPAFCTCPREQMSRSRHFGTGLALYHRHGQRDTLRAPALPSI